MWLTETSKNLVVRMGLFFCYIFLGAVIFQALEAKNELRERTSMAEAKKHLQVKYNISDKDLKEFLQRIEEIVDHGFSKHWVRRWNLLGSLFFSGTVVTTIGYGHVAPCTRAGKLFCIVYALIGIPLTWLMLSTLAKEIMDLIAVFIRFCYQKILHSKPESLAVKCAIITALISFSMIMIIALFGMYLEGWSYLDGVYFGFITLTTIGFGDFVPLHPSPARNGEGYPAHVMVFTIMSIVYFTIGLACVTSMLLAIRNAMEERSLQGFHAIMENSDDEEEKDKKCDSFEKK